MLVWVHKRASSAQLQSISLTKTLSCMVIGMQPKAGEGNLGQGKHLPAGQDNLAEGSLAVGNLGQGNLGEAAVEGILGQDNLGEGKHLLAWEGTQGNLGQGSLAEGSLAEGSLAEAGEGRQTSHKVVVEPA